MSEYLPIAGLTFQIRQFLDKWQNSLLTWQINFMIYPSLALFLGTGNATPNLPSVMMERLYTSPTYGMCE